MSETICAVVVTYNRKQFLLECLEGIIKQTRPVDAIYLIDNASTDGTPLLLLQNNYIKIIPPENLNEPWEGEFEFKNPYTGGIIKFHYVRMHENTGSSGGFHEGLKRAYEKGYDWFWLMDDDGLPTVNCLELLINSPSASTDRVVINSLVLSLEDKGKLSFYVPKISTYNKVLDQFEWTDSAEYVISNAQNSEYPWGSFFNSVLIKRHIVERVGYPRKEFYIHGDEVEYFYRIKKFGFTVVIQVNSIFFHPKPNLDKRKNTKSARWKEMYEARNKVYIYRNYKKLWFIRVLRDVLSAIFNRKFYLLKPIYHGLVGKFDNTYHIN